MTESNIEQEIIKLYKEGLSGKKIQDQTGISATQVRRILKKYNVQARSNKTEDNIEQNVINRYNQGLSSEMIAKELDLNPTTICRILKRNNINIKGAGYFNRQYEINENFFNTIDNEEKAYFLGFWYADGYVHSNRTSIRLCLHKQDIDVLLKFKSLVFTGNYELTYAEEDKYISLYVYSHIMRDDLIKHGCGPRKTFNITMPNLPEILMPHFFRGLYDGDGCIYISPKNTVTVRLTGYLPFMKEIQQYMQKHDVSGNSRNVKHKELVGEFAIASQQEVDKMLDYLYKDAIIYLDRKYKKYLRAKEIFREKS